VISNYSISGGPGDVPVENVSLDYGIIQYSYKPQKQESASANALSVKHNLETGIIE
jgi:type VI secretion system secreted protein Hcp